MSRVLASSARAVVDFIARAPQLRALDIFGGCGTCYTAGMIMRLQGTVLERGPDWVLLGIGGIGYRVDVAAVHAAEFSVGQEAVMWTHEAIRDDKHELFGVRTREHLELFWKLIGVSGIGPKAAVKILGLFEVETLRRHVMDGDADFLTAVPGIGKKKAQKIVLELRGSIDFTADNDARRAEATRGELIDALVGMGYQRAEARTLAAGIPEDINRIEDQIKAALTMHA